MAITVSGAPSVEPVSTAEAKAHLRVDHSDDDTYIGRLIKAAREEAEVYLCRSIITTTLVLTLDKFPVSDPIWLMMGKVQSITSIAYVDDNGTNQTYSSALYQTDLSTIPARVQPAYNQSYPSTRTQMNAVTITYKAGYGDASTSVPESVRQAILLRVGDLYEHRESFIIGAAVSPIPRAMERLLDSERIVIVE